ncbi:transcription-repair coupling factor [Ignavibacteria bacterium 4148-Me]|uniref:transcription-repair coupling factor n=1 Tax=Rosettibacter primus TaxID=3111523 RepID=UPI00336BF8E6
MKSVYETFKSSFSFFESLKKNIVELNPGAQLFVSNFAGSSRNLFVAHLFNKEKQIFLLCEDLQSLNESRVELDLLGLGDKIVVIDEFDTESVQEKLTDLTTRENFILISVYELLTHKFPSNKSFKDNITQITTGSNISYNEVIEYLNLLNYNQERFVDKQGDFAIRGSIIDFWSYSEKHPCRLEFDGDFIESIRHFDPESQRSTTKVDFVTIAPLLNDSLIFTENIFSYLNNPVVFATDYKLKELTNCSLDKEPIENVIGNNDLDEDLIEELFESKSINSQKKIFDTFKNEIESKVIYLENLFNQNARWVIEDTLNIYNNKLNLELSEPPAINSNFELLITILKNYLDKGNKIIVTAENELQSKRLSELITEFDTGLANFIEEGKIKIISFPIKAGFVSRNDKIVVLTDYQIFNKPYRTKIPARLKFKKSRTKDFASIKKGDFVVHEIYGIGQYAGLETIKIGDVEQESIKILYADGDVVYVNLNYLSLVKKFSSKDNVQPKLTKLGSGEWTRTKKKVKSKIKDAARELITLYAKRKLTKGFAFSPDTIWQKELEASFFYEDTPDQMRVTEEVKNDMESENPMDRLVCGDVGFGKTEIAVRAAFKAVNDSKQAALLVPTTILAEQHFNTFKDRLAQFPVRIEMLSRFRSPKEQKEIIEKLAKGEIDIIIGTHRLLSNDVQFKDLGLLIIDEEHRFGVMAKEKLRSFKANVDTLTLTATPIPRTLNLSLLGARDLSIIATPPPNRQPIYTKVDTFDIFKIRQWILFEVNRGGQVYFIHDRIQSIDKIAAYVQKHVPEVKIGIAHGQMKASQLEKVIHDFLNKRFDVLISTKIIESGIDIPSVNTIIINRADRFGLAELHQLRGRVGRSDKQAYAYLLVPSIDSVTKKAVKRLQAIEEYTDLGEGFNISMRDLEIRGAGNLLGTEQSGFIDSVGFDMYLKLVDEAVEELRQSEFREVFKDLPKQIERSEPTIDSFFEIGIPQNYMPDQSDRLGFYTALFSMLKIDEVEEIKEEMIDRFGKLPQVVERLMLVASLRFYASFALLERIIIQRKKTIIILPKGNREDYYQNKFIPLLNFIYDNYSKSIKFIQQNETLKLEIINNSDEPEKILEFLIELCKQMTNIISEEKLNPVN